jgi:hypothetical protein
MHCIIEKNHDQPLLYITNAKCLLMGHVAHKKIFNKKLGFWYQKLATTWADIHKYCTTCTIEAHYLDVICTSLVETFFESLMNKRNWQNHHNGNSKVHKRLHH